jgi:hypothetical protein
MRGNNDPERQSRGLPLIVVYPDLGQKNAQYVLDKIIETMGSFDIGSGQEPKYNQKVNDLIYYAQGDRDWKEDFLFDIKYLRTEKGAPSVNKVLEEDSAHFRKEDGTYHLQIKNIAK